MGIPVATRLKLKIKRIARKFTVPAREREWDRLWPFIDSVEGWLLNNEGKWLFDTARSLPDGAKIVEIGSFKGRSTCCLAAGCRASAKRVFAIDTFDGGPNLPDSDSFPEFSDNLEKCRALKTVVPIVGLSTDVAKTWRDDIHFLFVDGSHNYEDVLADFASFFAHVIPGGIIAFHDVGNPAWPGVLKAWHETIEHQLDDVGYCGTLGYGRKSHASYRSNSV